MSTLFISDLHLEPNLPELTDLFLRFLQTQATTASALYILGDFFEVWVGDDNSDAFNQSISSALQQVAQKNIPIYLMPGNRDFLIGQRFAQRAGCQLLADPTVIDLYGTKTLLTHGDCLCIKDRRHQRFRAFSRTRWIQQIFLRLPLKLRIAIARKIRARSQQHTRMIPDHIMDVTPEAVTAMLQRYGISQMIHGHTHRPAIHTLTVAGQTAKRIVLGAWHDVASVLVCSADQPPTLQTFK